MADHAEDKDVPMEAQDEVEDEDDLVGTKDDSEDKDTEEQKEEEEETDPCDDSGAASEIEFGAEDDRFGHTDQDTWTWHIEMYPITPEDTMLDNFVKLVTTSEQSNVVFKTNENGEKRGEAHFYTNDSQAAKVIIRTICCRKFNIVRPFVYLYYRHEDGEMESASLRLDLIEAAKMRWDRQRKNVGKCNTGDPSTRVAKISNVPLSTSQEFLSVLFARAFHIKRESDESEEAAKKAGEAEAKSKEKNNEDDKDEEDKDESNEEEEEELVGEFNGNLTIDCVSRTSLKGFLLGYRKVTMANSLLNIRALSAKDFKMEELRKEVRKKRKEDAKQLAGGKSGKMDDSKSGGKPGNRDARGSPRGARGVRGGPTRGGRGDYRGSGRGGIMTGRQKMEEKMRRGGGRDMRGGGRGYGMRDEMQYQMAMNTYRLERQMISMRGRGRGFGLLAGGYRDFPPDPYDMPPMGPRGYSDYDPRDDWAYRSPAPRYGDGLGMGRIPRRGLRGRRL